MKQSQKFSCATVLTLIFLALSASVSEVYGETYAVNNHQIEITLVPDKTAIMLDEPTYLSFIVQNHSNTNLLVLMGGDYQNRLGRPESFTVTVTGKDGKGVFQPEAGQSLGGLFGPQKLLANEKYIFRLFLPNWATFKGTGEYSITAARDLQIVDGPLKDWSDTNKTTKVHVQTSTKIQIIPNDTKKMGDVISTFGDRMLANIGDDSGAAAHLLSRINDVRVIPYFAKTFETRNDELIFKALDALTKFNNKAAFQALKRGMSVQGKDIANTTTPVLADQSAGELRFDAAYALRRSPYPDAIPFLLTRRYDTYAGVRLVIVQTAAQLKSKTAIPILQEMSHDKDKLVSDEAKRYLNLLASKTN